MSGKSYYVLRGRVPVVVEDLEEWGNWFEANTNARRAAYSSTFGWTISTVFLGIDHRWGEGPPLLFETMVFRRDGMRDFYCNRYTTWEEAEEGHAHAVRLYSQPGAVALGLWTDIKSLGEASWEKLRSGFSALWTSASR